MNQLLRPKYQLNHAQLEGDRITIPAGAFTQLTGRHYPYARLGTRAPNNPSSNPGNTLIRRPYGYVRDGAVLKAVSGMQPHYMLDKATIEGVMPASTYMRLTGRRTTEFTLPPKPTARAPVSAPALAFDWGTFVGGVIAGGIITLGFVYGIIPALAEWGAAAIKKRY